VDHQYMAHQSNINEKMRMILIDWLVEVHMKYKQQPETLFLTVNIVDRYLARRLVSRSRLQLIGIAATLIASKYEQVFRSEVRPREGRGGGGEEGRRWVVVVTPPCSVPWCRCAWRT
jgi:hypothetical protein